MGGFLPKLGPSRMAAFFYQRGKLGRCRSVLWVLAVLDVHRTGKSLKGDSAPSGLGALRMERSYTVHADGHRQLEGAWSFRRTKGRIVKGVAGIEESSCCVAPSFLSVLNDCRTLADVRWGCCTVVRRRSPKATRSSQFETCAKNMSDLVSPPLKADRIRGCRNSSGHPAVSVISANGDFHAGHVDLLNDHVGELLGTAALFHHGDLHPGKCPAAP